MRLRVIATCCLALSMGGGCASYMEGSSSRTVGEFMDNTAIHAKVKSALLAADDVSGLKIDVDVHRGVVDLYGPVASDTQRAHALAAVRNIAGVKRVEDHLKVVP